MPDIPASTDSFKVMVAGFDGHESQLIQGWISQAGLSAVALESPQDYGADGGSALGCQLGLVSSRALPDGASCRAWMSRCPASLIAVVDANDVAAAVRLMKAGFSSCLSRPLQKEKFISSMRGMLRGAQLQNRVDGLRGRLAQKEARSRFLGDSPILRHVLSLAAKVADFPVNVLISGESGTGKELAAGLIHALSGRRHGPFEAVDCGAIPSELVESELFGHVKGAFTDAAGTRVGRIEMASGGTLFLDEVGNLPAPAQAKLLRALQQREVWPLGAPAPRQVDIRVISATNLNLEDPSGPVEFRPDLYHRLCEFPLRMPPLRERKGDVELLLRFYLDTYATRFGRNVSAFSAPALARLLEYPWPGNVRQLENAMKHCAVMAGKEVQPEDLPPEILNWTPPARPSQAQEPAPFVSFDMPENPGSLWEAQKAVSAQVEKRHISEALLSCRWDRAKAAGLLGLHVKTLSKKLKEYGLN